MSNKEYILVFALTIISSTIYGFRQIYLAREKKTQTIVSHFVYVFFNNLVTISVVKGNPLLASVISAVSGSIGFFLTFKIKEKFDPSIESEDKIWVFTIQVLDEVAEEFNKKFCDKYGIKYIKITKNEWQYICSNKKKSKQVRNFIEVYELDHTIHTVFKFKNKKLDSQQKSLMRKKIGMSLQEFNNNMA